MSSMLYLVGGRLAELIGKAEYVCRGTIRLAIEDSMPGLQQPTDYKVLQQRVNTMDFREWEMILQSEVLSQRLSNMGVSDPASVVTTLVRTLVEKQSLLTMATY